MEISKQNLPRRAAKIFFIVFVFILIAVVSYVAGVLVKYRLDTRKADKSVERFQGALEEPYKQDTYGGKTPEETWAMFLDALKKGDIDLASKYFAVEEVRSAQELLLKEKQNNKLNLLIDIYSQKLNKIDPPTPSPERADYYVLRENEVGQKERDFILFYFNPQTEIWKIVSL